jgi:hypothetical protein
MPKYVIERDLPGGGDLTSEDLRVDKIYCVYVARDAAIIEERARRGGLPVTRTSKVSSVIDPSTEE